MTTLKAKRFTNLEITVTGILQENGVTVTKVEFAVN